MVNEKFAAQVFGITRSVKTNCVCHNKPQSRVTFRDEVSFREFGISGLCQESQDDIFGESEEEDEAG
jgi:hypothetical protein